MCISNIQFGHQRIISCGLDLEIKTLCIGHVYLIFTVNRLADLHQQTGNFWSMMFFTSFSILKSQINFDSQYCKCFAYSRLNLDNKSFHEKMQTMQHSKQSRTYRTIVQPVKYFVREKDLEAMQNKLDEDIKYNKRTLGWQLRRESEKGIEHCKLVCSLSYNKLRPTSDICINKIIEGY